MLNLFFSFYRADRKARPNDGSTLVQRIIFRDIIAVVEDFCDAIVPRVGGAASRIRSICSSGIGIPRTRAIIKSRVDLLAVFCSEPSKSRGRGEGSCAGAN
jgi:hypothetical protein